MTTGKSDAIPNRAHGFPRHSRPLLGFPAGLHLTQDGQVMQNGIALNAEERKLSDLLMPCQNSSCRPFLWAASDALAAICAGDNIALYRATRNVFPAFPSVSRFSALAGDMWCADVVVYQGQPLPGGELCRSIGHWNPPSQCEIFQVLAGCVYMIAAGVLGTGEKYFFLETMYPGDLCCLPPGAWHLTYAPSQAVVFNVYNSPKIENSLENHEYHKLPVVPLGICRRDSGTSVFTRVEALAEWGTPADVGFELPSAGEARIGGLARLFSTRNPDWFSRIAEELLVLNATHLTGKPAIAVDSIPHASMVLGRVLPQSRYIHGV